MQHSLQSPNAGFTDHHRHLHENGIALLSVGLYTMHLPFCVGLFDSWPLPIRFATGDMFQHASS